ncbi:MAG TPA: YbaK/EbsC family protein [Terriglobales bacterium]|jgi:Ala-tRNA(Pro) deacylase|nr:YbaK/EbsC family protein [Terriglobales bacterium]
MPCPKLKDFLDRNEIKYELIHHPTTYTAQLTAVSSHLRPEELAKVVMVNRDGKLAMVVVSASRRVDITALHTGSAASSLRLASELEFKQRFPDCDAGAMPPFGNLYGMDVFVDEGVARQASIAFNAGSHEEVIRLAYEDFERLVKPKVLKFSTAAERAPRLRIDDRVW